LILIQDRWYIFDHKALHELSKEAIALHNDDMPKVISHIVSNLTQTHGTNHINVREHEWVFNNAGGMFLECKVLFLVFIDPTT
jgi:C-8 sterol isomerase